MNKTSTLSNFQLCILLSKYLNNFCDGSSHIQAPLVFIVLPADGRLNKYINIYVDIV